jgi:hypothetical protein
MMRNLLKTNTVTNTISLKHEEQEMTVVHLYPNPVNDVAFIRLEHRKGAEYTRKKIIRAEVIDVNGVLFWKRISVLQKK